MFAVSLILCNEHKRNKNDVILLQPPFLSIVSLSSLLLPSPRCKWQPCPYSSIDVLLMTFQFSSVHDFHIRVKSRQLDSHGRVSPCPSNIQASRAAGSQVEGSSRPNKRSADSQTSQQKCTREKSTDKNFIKMRQGYCQHSPQHQYENLIRVNGRDMKAFLDSKHKRCIIYKLLSEK